MQRGYIFSVYRNRVSRFVYEFSQMGAGSIFRVLFLPPLEFPATAFPLPDKNTFARTNGVPV